MNSGIKILLTLAIVSTLSGCKYRKKVIFAEVNAATVAKFWSNQMEYSTLEARGKATVTMNAKTHTLSMHLKMHKDSVVWAKFSLFGFGATVLITQDSFFMLDNINQQYMAYENTYLDQFLGFKAEVGQVQNLLLGNAVLRQNLYRLNPENTAMVANEGIATNTLDFNELFRTLVSKIETPDTTQTAHIQYDKYEIYEQSLMPKTVNIDVQKGDNIIKAVLNYQNVNSNPNLTFPFKIPNGYQHR
ncbi:MAG: DUF4292 domain-containing protein [Bacteroidia bacterium]|jgi:hypothetical protein|nr:DUF4292 domain-containing protein [Bacteroidia bacterium]